MTYHIFVSGRVQGVGYRRFAQKQAEALQIRGWTRNLLDGRVEIIAQATDAQLDEYCDMLRKGPAFSLVREVLVKAVDETSPTEEVTENGFEIRPDMELK
ncbi:MAG: acylphosphatase [Pseudobdellovibrionaceae bacterium]